MGYSISVRDSKFDWVPDTQDKALAALKKAAKLKRGTSNAPDPLRVRCWSWVDMDELLEAKTLEDAMECLRWVPSNGIIHFDGEKIGDEDTYFSILAPFIKDGSFIEVLGEDGALWRYAFEKGKLLVLDPQITWKY